MPLISTEATGLPYPTDIIALPLLDLLTNRCQMLPVAFCGY
jgi:hypothetical protein